MHDSRRRILTHLQASGEASVRDLAAVTGLAEVTVRHHLGVLRDRGLVELRQVADGPGRPRNVARLAPDGAATLYDGAALAGLAGDLLSALRAGEPGGADRFFRRLATETVAATRAEISGAPLERRLDAAVEILAERGFTMRWDEAQDGYLVRELGCPYHGLSAEYPEVCTLDRQVLAELVGGEVARVAWRGDGAPACAFLVRHAPDGPG